MRDIDYSPDGKHLVSVSEDCRLCVWDTTTGKCIHNIAGHRRNISSVRYSKDGQRLASWGWDGIIKVWDAKTLECLKEMYGKIHIDHVLDDDVRYLASSTNLRTVIIDRESDEIVAWWPQSIDLICMNRSNVIAGSTGSGYLPIFKLCGVEN